MLGALQEFAAGVVCLCTAPVLQETVGLLESSGQFGPAALVDPQAPPDRAPQVFFTKTQLRKVPSDSREEIRNGLAAKRWVENQRWSQAPARIVQ